MKRFLIALIGICVIAIVAQAQTSNQELHALVLITDQDHASIMTIDQLNRVISNIPSLMAITYKTDSIEITAEELRKLVRDAVITKQKTSSLQIMGNDIQNIKGVTFEQVSSVEDIKKALERSGNNLLLQIVSNSIAQRILSETHEQIIPTPISEEREQRSQMFANMSPVALTGLLVSLFLIIVLMIAINCLYGIKTNDQFGRANLWVGKES